MPDVSGLLRKKAGFGYHQRWFELKDEYLYQYKDKEGKDLKHTYHLKGSQVIESDENTFRLRGPQFPKSIFLKADSLQDKRRWINALNEVISKSPQSPTPIVNNPDKTAYSPNNAARSSQGPTQTTLQAMGSIRRLTALVPELDTVGSAGKVHVNLGERGQTRKDIRYYDDSRPTSNKPFELDESLCPTIPQLSPRAASPRRSVNIEDESSGTLVNMNSHLEGYDAVVREIDVGHVTNYDDLMKAIAPVYPELSIYGIKQFAIVKDVEDGTSDSEILTPKYDYTKLRVLAINHKLVIVTKRPLAVIEICADYDEEHFKRVELRFFAPNYTALLKYVHQHFPITRRYFKYIQYIDLDQNKVSIVDAKTDWNLLISECLVMHVLTNFIVEDKVSILQDWRLKLTRSSPKPTKAPYLLWPKSSSVPLNIIYDRVKGCIFGAILGNALGLATKGMTGEKALMMYKRTKDNLDFKDIDRTAEHRYKVKDGEWTSTADQIFVFLDSVMRNGGRIDPKDLAAALLCWSMAGVPELSREAPEELWLDNAEKTVLVHGCYLTDPHFASDCIYQEMQEGVSTNSVLWRAILSGVLGGPDLNVTKAHTLESTKVTHAHPRCMMASVAVSSTIQYLITTLTPNIDEIRDTLLEVAANNLDNIDSFDYTLRANALIELDLDDHYAPCDVYKPLGCGYFTLNQGDGADFKTLIRQVVMEAGDADNNAGIAGAFLGCKLGMSKLPADWLAQLKHRVWVEKQVNSLMSFMGVC